MRSQTLLRKPASRLRMWKYRLAGRSNGREPGTGTVSLNYNPRFSKQLSRSTVFSALVIFILALSLAA